ncbi:MAG: hypothetical protein KKD05_01940, partial [Candidatus Omnitrophica bacterium]|nr:hypothetical protein [Candidatus Omnitrophota bacterium]
MLGNNYFFYERGSSVLLIVTIFLCVTSPVFALNLEEIGIIDSITLEGQIEQDSSTVLTVPFFSLQPISAQDLAEQPSLSAAQILVASLGDTDATVQNSAFKSLLSLGKEAVPALLEGIESENQTIQNLSCAALGEIGDERSLMPLVTSSVAGYSIQDIFNSSGELVEKRIVSDSGKIAKSIFLSADTDITGFSNYRYNPQGNLSKIESFNSAGELTAVSVANSKGQIIQSTMYGAEGEVIGRTLYSYNNAGVLTQSQNYNAQRQMVGCTVYDSAGKQLLSESYDGQGLLTGVIVFAGLTKQDVTGENGAVIANNFIDADGNVRMQQTLGMDGSQTGTVLYRYNAHNRLVKTESFNSAGELTAVSVANSKGQVKQSTMYGAEGEVIGRTLYSYNNAGVLTQSQTYNTQRQMVGCTVFDSTGKQLLSESYDGQGLLTGVIVFAGLTKQDVTGENG